MQITTKILHFKKLLGSSKMKTETKILHDTAKNFPKIISLKKERSPQLRKCIMSKCGSSYITQWNPPEVRGYVSGLNI